MIRKLLFLIGLFYGITLNAQQELHLHFQRNIWQANRSNPAFLPDAKFVIGLPSIHNNLYLDGTNLSNLIDTENRRLTLSNAIDDLEEANLFRNYFELETLSGGLYLGKLHLSLHHALKLNAYSDFPKELAQLITQGNAQFIGETVDISHDIDAFSYSEFGLGLGYQLSDNFSIGGRVKYLNGIGNISTSRNSLFLTTDEDIYQLELNANYQIDASSLLLYNGLDAPEEIVQLGGLSLDEILTANQGIAFDVGAHLQFENFDLAFSLLDIGQITWEENTRNYVANGTYEYGGLDLVNAFLEDSIAFSTVLDSLENIFAVQETSNSYSTELPMRLYASFNYDLSDTWTAGLGVHGEWYRDAFFPALSFNAQTRLANFLRLGANYTLFDNRYDHLGLNAQFQLGPIQAYAMAGNLLSAIRPRQSSNVNVRLGVNLLFGRVE
ncbi:MAG: DUF5723 family protein [Bacteroidota bacterium]